MIKLSTGVIICIALSGLILSLFIALSFGAAPTKFLDVWLSLTHQSAGLSSSYIDKIIWELRLPRTLLAFLAGAGLAISGLILQTVTRNPLADPYLFGISTGASFGVVVLITVIGVTSGLAMSGAAFVGSLMAMSLLILVSKNQGNGQIEAMLLAGVALSFLFSAFTSLLLYWSDPQAVSAILFWTLGSFSRAQWNTLWIPGLVISICTVIMLAYRRQLNAMLLGDESATTLGINTQRFRLVMLLLSSLITATLVSLCGGIGFVGLMIPHIVRHFISQGRLSGLALTAFVGGIFMIWIDLLARTVMENQELPVGVITAALGSVFFLALLYSRKTKI